VRYRDHEYHAFFGARLLACALRNRKRCNTGSSSSVMARAALLQQELLQQEFNRRDMPQSTAIMVLLAINLFDHTVLNYPRVI